MSSKNNCVVPAVIQLVLKSKTYVKRPNLSKALRRKYYIYRNISIFHTNKLFKTDRRMLHSCSKLACSKILNPSEKTKLTKGPLKNVDSNRVIVTLAFSQTKNFLKTDKRMPHACSKLTCSKILNPSEMIQLLKGRYLKRHF